MLSIQAVVGLDEALATGAAVRDDQATKLDNLIPFEGRPAAFVFPPRDLNGRLHSRSVGSGITYFQPAPHAVSRPSYGDRNCCFTSAALRRLTALGPTAWMSWSSCMSSGRSANVL